jgi:hypothetical protein
VLVSADRVYYVFTNNILMWIYEVQCTRYMRGFTIDYLYMLFVADSV